MILPLHPQPLPGEILSSWMVRLAFANGYPLHTFYSGLLGYKASIWNRDIDRHAPLALLECLSHSSGQSVSNVQALTLQSYEGVLCERFPISGCAQWILPVGVFHRTRSRAGMQFCSLCLRGDLTPYYRRSWRLALYAICEHHKCVMHDRCPSCKATIAYHRHGIGRGRVVQELAFLHCHTCQFALIDTKPVYLRSWTDSLSLDVLLTTISSFEQGLWGSHQLSVLPCGISYFSGLRILVGVIMGHYGYRLRCRLSDILGVPVGISQRRHCIEFESLDAIERLKLLLSVLWLLGDWPKRFVSLCREVGLTRYQLGSTSLALPFWLASAADELKDQRAYMPNIDEVGAVERYMVTHNKPVNEDSIRKVLGLSKERGRLVWSLLRNHSGV